MHRPTWADPPALLVATSERGAEMIGLQGVPEPPIGRGPVGPRCPVVGRGGLGEMQAQPVRWSPVPVDALAPSSAGPTSAFIAVLAVARLVVGPLLGAAANWQAEMAQPSPPMFSPDQRWLACGTWLFDATNHQSYPLPGPAPPFLADGRGLVATTGGDHPVEVPA